MLAAIWTDPDAAEIFFLIAAIVFAVEVVLVLTKHVYTGILMALGAALLSVGFLAL